MADIRDFLVGLLSHLTDTDPRALQSSPSLSPSALIAKDEADQAL